MGSNTIFDPIRSISGLGLGDYEAVEMSKIPSTSYSGKQLEKADTDITFSEDEESRLRSNVTKKRLGTKQAMIPLQADTVSKE